MSATSSITSIYNPKLKGRDQLINEFVVRVKIFNNIFGDIKKSKMKHPEQHYLLIGQRGAGKTTLLERLKYAIEDDAQLKDWLIPVSLNEEQYNVSELANLWETIAEILEDYHNMPGILDEMQSQLDAKNYEASFFKILTKYLEKNKKKLVLLIDNIGDILAKFDETDVKRFREILMTSPNIRLIAGSPVVLDGLFDYHNPLLEFFNITYLKGLDRAEMELLLLTLGKLYDKEQRITKVIKDTPERIEVFRRLTGGVPRTIVMLFNIFVDNQDGKALKDFIAVIDQATPLYKHNMDDLPIQQQKIVDAVAKAWDGVPVKEIKEKVRMEGKNISTQLSLLEKNQIIIKRKLPESKNYIYMLQDRFFNIWYLMRHGRRYDKKRVEWLVRFFEAWLDKDELESRILAHIGNLEKGTYDPHAAVLMFDTYKQCNIDFDSKIKLLRNTKAALPNGMKSEVYLPNDELRREVEKELLNSNYKKVLEIGTEVENDTYILYAIAVSLKELGKIKESETALKKSLQIERNHYTLVELGVLYATELLDYANSKKYLIEGIAAEFKYYTQLKIKTEKNLVLSKNTIQDTTFDIIFMPDHINYLLGLLGTIMLKEPKQFNNKDKSILLELANNGFPEAFAQLGFIDFALDRFSEMYVNFDKAISNGSKHIFMLILYLDSLIDQNINLPKAKIILEKLINSESINQFPSSNFLVKLFMAKYSLWDNEIELSLELFEELLNTEAKAEEGLIYSQINQFLMILVAKEQLNSAQKLFKNEDFNLIDHAKPIYFAFMKLINNEGELLKMGDELNETVEEVVKEILELREKYKNPPREVDFTKDTEQNVAA